MADPMQVYNKIRGISPEARTEAEAYMNGLTKKYTEEKPIHPELMQKDLEGILAKHQQGKPALAYAAGLAAITMMMGIPYF